MLMLIGLAICQEPKPTEGIKDLVPDHARHPVVEFGGIRWAIEYFPQDATGPPLGGFDIQHTKENAPAVEQWLQIPGGSRVVDLKHVERRDKIEEVARQQGPRRALPDAAQAPCPAGDTRSNPHIRRNFARGVRSRGLGRDVRGRVAGRDHGWLQMEPGTA